MSSLYKEDRISLISRAAIFSSALLVLSNYYYLYFLEFSQGGAPQVRDCWLLFGCLQYFCCVHNYLGLFYAVHSGWRRY